MPDRRSQTPSRVTLEDLLRLKRAERPPPEFWAGFERELREKQLAALVERKSWWHGPAAAFSRFGWLRVPVGAAAVLAVTLVSIRHYSSFERYRDEQPAVETQDRSALVAMTPVTSTEPGHADHAGVVTFHNPEMPGEGATAESAEAGRAEPDAPATTLQQAAEPVKHQAGSGDAADSSGFEPLAESVGIQLHSPGGIDTVLVEAAARPAGFEDRSISTLRPRRAAEVLPTAVAVTEQRRSRLLAALGSVGVYAPEPSAPEHVKRSVIRYLVEDGWDRSMSRLHADADHLSFRF